MSYNPLDSKSSHPKAMGDDVYAVILAGGSGTRFWPKSRQHRPKQLTAIGNEPRTMLEVTLGRLDGFIPPERRLLVTHQAQIAATRQIVGDQCGIFLAEPEAKNTANALALAALEIAAIDARRHGSGRQPVMISLHADHIIRDEEGFRGVLAQAVAVARSGRLTLLGVVPDRPETGFGYIERGAELKEPPHAGAYSVASFREKPELATAVKYVDSRRFYWNAGLFVWQIEVLLTELRRNLAPTLERLGAALQAAGGTFQNQAANLLAPVYKQLPKISIDHAILETSTNIAVVPADIGWQDVGSWDAIERAVPPDAAGNLRFGNVCLLDSNRTTIESDGPFVAAVGVDNLVIVCSGGATLVCPKSRAQDVKDIVAWLEAQGRRDLM